MITGQQISSTTRVRERGKTDQRICCRLSEVKVLAVCKGEEGTREAEGFQ